MNHALHQWCADQLNLPTCDISMLALGGDAGFRRYYRLTTSSDTYIATDAPVEHIDNHAFVSIGQRLANAGVNVPKILGVDYQQGFLLQSDLGDDLLLSLLNADTVDDFYAQGLAMIVQMQDADTTSLPQYDTAMLHREMMLFKEWFLPKLLGVTLSEENNNLLDETFACLAQLATQQPQAFVHRDFHSRNILHHNDALATIDYQDAVHGPITYDAVSLLKDCYIRWPLNDVEQWLEDFHAALIEVGTIDAATPYATTRRDFHAMGLQRHIKVLGIFARLSLRDGKHGYLLDLPLVIQYTLEAANILAEEHPILGAFGDWFERELSPLIALQEWSHGR